MRQTNGNGSRRSDIDAEPIIVSAGANGARDIRTRTDASICSSVGVVRFHFCGEAGSEAGVETE